MSTVKTETNLLTFIKQILNTEPNAWLKSPAWDVIQAILLGKQVVSYAIMPNSDRSYNDAIASGEIIASLDNYEEYGELFTPQVPEIMLHKWAFDNTIRSDATPVLANAESEIAIELKKVLNVRFSAVSLEDILAGREFMLSRIYGSPSLLSSYCNISLKRLYPFSRYCNKSFWPIMDVKIDASKPLIHSTCEKSLPTLANNIIYKPTCPTNTNPGYDFRIRFSLVDNTKKFVDVYYQVKIGEADSPTSLTSVELQESYRKCTSFKASRRSAGFIVMFMTCRDGGQKIEVPPGCLLLHKDALKATLGPNFCNFVETLNTHSLLMVE